MKDNNAVDSLLEELNEEIGPHVDSIEKVNDSTIVIQTGLDGWNELFVKDVCRILIETTSEDFGASFDEDMDGFNGFTATIKHNSDNPRMYLLPFGKYLGLSPSVINSSLKEVSEESENPVESAIDGIEQIAINTGKATSRSDLLSQLT